jgi:formate dehydrogenase major subunit
MKVLPQTGTTPPKSPLPHTNSRFGTLTPQTGVEVERKWKRADYRMPGNDLVQIKTL